MKKCLTKGCGGGGRRLLYGERDKATVSLGSEYTPSVWI